ncbi:MAG: Nif3-like dinuclear metal center hexameric protein [Gemmatimonadales bacterium]|nr:Nif3-like dinuclear metal center hexameric protein [Gemmatimonadales bacterium]NIN10404.1 Nif3-like dinuclear metal center hexameric protein [Gemmatimonadales bacterium]NIN49196.1 Nif3-like dinuclear metal center hexameric protein [Gemmatimonadales bacterium]NIP06660.1 Nif3-like dinuclear metal center hexameric protein [Gemmatimonadales bacterium]NIQ99990.1 Nif3-like dinuclear metal center hexameric protein [Gemmatimonadales bacterium]
MPARLRDLTAYLDDYLRIAEVADEPNAVNGLQVEHDGTVEHVVAAVDACQATIDAAAERGADFLLVHHGLFWGGVQPLTGRHGRRVRKLVQSGIALYAAHTPLDLHPEVGNNAVLARMLGVDATERFGVYRGHEIGVAGTLEVSREELVDRIRGALGVEPHLIPTGPELVRRIGVITGGAGDMIRAAWEAGLDTYVSGEGPHHTHFDAEEWRLNVIYAGHYATETVGVKALAAHIEGEFGLPWEFVDHPTGL